MVGATEEATQFRKHLTIDEIPLPRGYPRSILDPLNKELQGLRHEEKIRTHLEARVRINERADKDAAYRKVILELCRRDPIFFINHFVWTYDDRIGVDAPMVCYDFQEEKMVKPYLRMTKTKGRERMTMCIEKSRGVGFSWVELACRAWAFAFLTNWSILIGAVHVLDVDDGGQEATHESLFGKLRYILNHLPRWMRDELFGNYLKKDSHNKRLQIKNPFKPRNIIVGKQFGAMFGRGHRYSEILGDEIAHADEMKNADVSLKQTTNRASFGSTPAGKHTFHFQLMRGPMKVVRRTIHWSEHPELDIEWYNEQRQHMTDEAIAQELDIDYESSAGNRVLPEVKISSHFWKPEHPDTNVHDDTGRPVWDGTIYVPTLPLQIVIDPGISDAMAVIWTQEDLLNGEWRVVDFVQKEDVAIDWLVPFIIGHVPESTYRGEPWPHDYNEVEMALIRRHDRWNGPAEVFGDAYGTTRSIATSQTAYDVLAKYDIDVCPITIQSNLQAISHLQLFMRHVKISAHLEMQRNGPDQMIPTLGEVVTQWRYKKPKEGSPTLTLVPVHDQYCHGGDCLKMWAQTADLPDPSRSPVGAGRVHRAQPPTVSVSRPFRPRR
jgi:hypothetical protein